MVTGHVLHLRFAFFLSFSSEETTSIIFRWHWTLVLWLMHFLAICTKNIFIKGNFYYFFCFVKDFANTWYCPHTVIFPTSLIFNLIYSFSVSDFIIVRLVCTIIIFFIIFCWVIVTFFVKFFHFLFHTPYSIFF